MMKRNLKSFVLAAIFIIGATGGGCSMFSKEKEYATFERPDGKYKIVVMRQESFFSKSPGQAGDSPGEVLLVNKAGEVLQKTDVEMVQLVENVTWEDKKVYIKLVADWDLPD